MLSSNRSRTGIKKVGGGGYWSATQDLLPLACASTNGAVDGSVGDNAAVTSLVPLAYNSLGECADTIKRRWKQLV